jgi:hypothetical protein
MAALELLWPISGSRRALRYDRKARGRCGASTDAHRSALCRSSNLAPARVSALDVPQLSYPAARCAVSAATTHDRPNVQRAALCLDGIRRRHGGSAGDRYHRASPSGSARTASTAAPSRKRDRARSDCGSSSALVARRRSGTQRCGSVFVVRRHRCDSRVSACGGHVLHGSSVGKLANRISFMRSFVERLRA